MPPWRRSRTATPTARMGSITIDLNPGELHAGARGPAGLPASAGRSGPLLPRLRQADRIDHLLKLRLVLRPRLRRGGRLQVKAVALVHADDELPLRQRHAGAGVRVFQAAVFEAGGMGQHALGFELEVVFAV